MGIKVWVTKSKLNFEIVDRVLKTSYKIVE